MTKYAAMFIKKLVDEDYISYKFIIKWADKEVTLDKFSPLRKKPAEQKFLEGLTPLIDYLR